MMATTTIKKCAIVVMQELAKQFNDYLKSGKK